MSMTLANLKLAVYSRLAAEEAAPDYSAINEDNITRWANELTSETIQMLQDTSAYQALIYRGYSLTFTSGVSTAVPSDFIKEIALRLGGSYVSAKFISLDAFRKWDSSNFITTPSTSFPVATVADNKVLAKPTSYIAGYLDYVKKHPTLSASQNTVFSSVGDNLLIELIVKKALTFLETMD